MNGINEQFEKAKEIIIQNKMHYGLLAEKIGIKAPQFSEKIRCTRYNKFTQEQKENLIKHLLTIGLQINSLK